tara:strand:- start:191 stop:502 length:312 start_codon:yes stop_codon:yes gene_type:complete
MKNAKILIFISFLLVSCSSFKEAGKVLRNEKIKTTDEFLVEKRDPLVFPPDYEKMPEPGTKIKKEISEEERIKKILKAPEAKETTKNKKSSSLEESLLKSIRK